jgi:outer membrane murein-binding lipoprotein Lpp
MARAAKAIKSTKSVMPARKPGRSPTIAADQPATATKAATSKRSTVVATPIEKREPGRPAKATIPPLPKAKRTTKAPTPSPATPSVPKASKDELRAQVEKLEQLVATLRAKSRETNRAAKAATARISELEAQVAQLEKDVAAAPVPVREPKPMKPARAKRQGREINPGDAVPPGVAVQQPAPLDEESETAFENLEEHLGHE